MRSKYVVIAVAAFLAFGIASCVSSPKPAAGASGTDTAVSLPAGSRVAIFNFELKGGGSTYASVGSDAAEAVTEALLRGGALKPVERRELEAMLKEMELGQSGLVDETTAARIGKLAGARYAMLGSASVLEGQVRLSCRLIDVETGEIVFADSAYGDTGKVYDIAASLAGKVQKRFSK